MPELPEVGQHWPVHCVRVRGEVQGEVCRKRLPDRCVVKALVYGHSQSGGMGLDLVKQLRAAGIETQRVTHVGYTDKKLIAARADVTGGPFDVVVLYAGGNSSKPTPADIIELARSFPSARVSVVLPPVNTDRESSAVAALRDKVAGNKAGAEQAGLKVYTVEAGGSQFWPDKVHMRPGAAASVQLAKTIVGDVTGSNQRAVLGALVIGAVVLWAVKRWGGK